MNSKNNIAKHYYDTTQQRYTKATYVITIKQAEILLQAGYKEDEIKSAIEYCYKHPPKNGFHSLGWLQYDIENILKKLKIEQIKEEQRNKTTMQELTTETYWDRLSDQDRAGEEFNFNDFKGE